MSTSTWREELKKQDWVFSVTQKRIEDFISALLREQVEEIENKLKSNAYIDPANPMTPPFIWFFAAQAVLKNIKKKI